MEDQTYYISNPPGATPGCEFYMSPHFYHSKTFQKWSQDLWNNLPRRSAHIPGRRVVLEDHGDSLLTDANITMSPGNSYLLYVLHRIMTEYDEEVTKEKNEHNS